MTKTAELFAFDRSSVDTIVVDDAFYGYPMIIAYEDRYFTLRNAGGFSLAAVDSATYQRYDEATIVSDPASLPQSLTLAQVA